MDCSGTLHPSLKVCEVSRPRDPQRWAFVLDAPRPDNGFSVHNNSVRNLIRGLNERVFYTDNKGTLAIKPQRGAFEALHHFVEDFQTQIVVPWDIEVVRDSFHGSQLNRYTRAYNSLLLEPFSKGCRGVYFC